MATLFRPSGTSPLILTSVVGLEIATFGKHEAWLRWITASINEHFINSKGTLPMYLEGDERTLQDEAEFYELRIDGPNILQTQKDCFWLNVEINVLTQAHMDAQKLYNIQTAVGPIIKAFTNVICVYRFGDGLFDDQTLLGELHLQRDLDEFVSVNYFGIIKEDVRMTQATVEGHYRLEINNGSD